VILATSCGSLHGIDLEGEHRRPPPFDRTRIIRALAGVIVIIAAVVAVLLTRGGTELEETADTPIVPEAVVPEAVPDAIAPATIPQVIAPNRPIATDQLMPDLSGLPIVQPARPVSYQRPARTD
jgi:hypothetical protein